MAKTPKTSKNPKLEAKVMALKKLWEKSRVADSFPVFSVSKPQWDQEKAEEAVNEYVSYFQGRVIGANLSDPKFDAKDASMFGAYDNDNGKGAAKRALGW